MNSPAYDLTNQLNNELSLNLSLGVDLFYGEFGEPNKQLLIMDAPTSVAVNQRSMELASIQLLARGNHDESPNNLFLWAKPIFNFIRDLPATTLINNTCYTSFTIEIPLQHLGKDDRNRHMHTMQFQTARRAYEL